MYQTSTQHQNSAAEGMWTYGLSGIELGHRAGGRQAATEGRTQLREVEVRGRVNNIRQWLGDAMIRAGAGLAGSAARAPRATAQTRATMP